jgi:hypothetical protein
MSCVPETFRNSNTRKVPAQYYLELVLLAEIIVGQGFQAGG